MKRRHSARPAKEKKQPFQWAFLLLAAVFVAAVVVFANYIGYDAETATIASEEARISNGDAGEAGSIIIGPPGSAHHHSTFLIFIHGRMARFDGAEYFETSPYVHLHDYSFAEIHTEATNITLGFFFETIGIELNSSCIAFNANQSYCSNETHTLKFYVEGNRSSDYGSHFTSDWEHYLITYGDESDEDIKEQIDRVPDPQASPAPEGKGRTERVDVRSNLL